MRGLLNTRSTCDVSSYTTLTVYVPGAYLSPVECDPASQFMCADQAKCVDIRFCCDSNHFSESGVGSEEKTATLH